MEPFFRSSAPTIPATAAFMRRRNGWLTVFWIAMIPTSIATHWVNSVTYVSALSLWALVTGHWSTWQTARIEVAQSEAMAREEEEPVEKRVVDRLVEETDLERGATTA